MNPPTDRLASLKESSKNLLCPECGHVGWSEDFVFLLSEVDRLQKMVEIAKEALKEASNELHACRHCAMRMMEALKKIEEIH